MAKIKLTKSELKAQRDALKQFTRYLPTLQLKKQQLQMEMRDCEERMKKNLDAEKEVRNKLLSWVQLFGTTNTVEVLTKTVSLEKIDTSRTNIAGVDVPVYKEAIFNVSDYNLFETDYWFDEAIAIIKRVIEIRAEYKIIKEQRDLIAKELRTTTQRVNLFEKVKIPECKENIRTIQIYLGDQQTAAVGRSKIAKRKMEEVA
jgi:V/A-type H+-transporting ATPase subunit D